MMKATLSFGIIIISATLVTASLSNAGQEHLTDLAAIQTQDRSIAKLEKLLKNNPSPDREAEFLSRLADLYLEKTGMTFRVSEGIKEKQKKSALYANSMNASIKILSQLIQKYPQHYDVPYALFKRGKVYKELEKIDLSRKDYVELFQKYSKFKMLDSALIDLADFAVDANQHDVALTYLNFIQEHLKKSEYYPIAIHRAAWCHFNLKALPTALDLLQAEIKYYFQKLENVKNEKKSELAFLETAFSDLALFSFEAINQKSSGSSPKNAFELFKKIDTSQKLYGLATLKLARLLKAYDLIPELTSLKNKLVSDEIKLPETTEIAILLFQYQTSKYNYKNLDVALEDFKLLDRIKTEPCLNQTLADLHQLVLKNKDSTEVNTLLNPLIMLTHSVQDILGEATPASQLALFGLAETQFALKKYSAATENYLKLYLVNALPDHQILDRLIASRYQELKIASIVSEKLAPAALSEPVKNLKSADAKLLDEWLTWAANSKTNQFDYDKLLYEYKDRKIAVSYLLTFSWQNHTHADAVTALDLVLDTYYKSSLWPEIIKLTHDFSSKIKDTKTLKKMTEFGKESQFRVTFAHAQDEIKSSNAENALKLLNSLDHQIDNPTFKQSALLLRVETQNMLGKFDDSTRDLVEYQNMNDYKDEVINQTILRNYSFKHKWAEFDALLKKHKICTSINAELCEQMNVVRYFEHEPKPNLTELYRKSVHGSKKWAAIWALAALKEPKKLPFNDRLVFLQRISNTWEDSDASLQLILLPTLISRVSETLESVQVSAPGIAPLQASNPNSIEKRVILTQEITQAFSKTTKLPWHALKFKAVEQLNLYYARLIQDLRKIQTPEDLLSPFISKLNETATAMTTLEKSKASSSFTDAHTVRTFLISKEVAAYIPTQYAHEWQESITQNHAAYSFYLIDQIEKSNEQFKPLSPLYRGSLFLLLGAQSEAFDAIQNASDHPLKSLLLSHFNAKLASLRLPFLFVLIAHQVSNFSRSAYAERKVSANYSKSINFEDDVIEGINRKPLDSVAQISESDRKSKPHLYRKRKGFNDRDLLLVKEAGLQP